MMATEEAGLIAEGIRNVKSFLESFRDVGGTQSTLNHIKVSKLGIPRDLNFQKQS
jgi:hypothetical protein